MPSPESRSMVFSTSELQKDMQKMADEETIEETVVKCLSEVAQAIAPDKLEPKRF